MTEQKNSDEPKKKKGKISESEFNKLSNKEQEKILINRKEKVEKLKEIANQDIDSLLENFTTDNGYSSKANKVYFTVRKSLVVLKAQRKLNLLTGKEYYDTIFSLFKKMENI